MPSPEDDVFARNEQADSERATAAARQAEAKTQAGVSRLTAWRNYFARERELGYPNADGMTVLCCEKKTSGVAKFKAEVFGGRRGHQHDYLSKRVAYLLSVSHGDRGDLYYYCVLPEEVIVGSNLWCKEETRQTLEDYLHYSLAMPPTS